MVNDDGTDASSRRRRQRPRSATVLAASTSTTATTAVNNNHHQPGRGGGGGGLFGFASSSGRAAALRARATAAAAQVGGTTRTTAVTTATAIDATDLSRTKRSLENTLRVNRQLQEHVLQELQRIARCKRENRIETEAAIRRLLDRPSDNDDDSLPSWMQPDAKIRPKDLNALFVSSSETETTTTTTTTDTNITDTSSKSRDRDDKTKQKRKWNTSKVRQFRFDPYRKWPMEYFVDPTGSRPLPNADLTLRHRTMYGGGGAAAAAAAAATEGAVGPFFFHHTQQPFTNKEKSHLKRLLSEATSATTTTMRSVGNDDGSPDDFYRQVAHDLNQEYHAFTTPTKKQKADKMMLPTNRPRTARDVQLYHQRQVASNYQFSQQESQTIIDMVSTHCQSGRRPDWNAIADKLLLMLQDNANLLHPASSTLSTSSTTSSPTTIPPPPITAYQCMVHYKTKLAPMLAASSSSSSSTPSSSPTVVNNAFTPQEDEFLLRYVAAMGPQFVWDMHQISDVAGRLLGPKPNQSSSSSSSSLPGGNGSGGDDGGKTPKRIHDRTTASLWNPLVKDTYWALEEERKLVLAMKVYHEPDGGACGGGGDRDDVQTKAGNANNGCHDVHTDKEPVETSRSLSAIRRAAQHFYPQRQPDKVAKKWERSLRPSPIRQDKVVDSVDNVDNAMKVQTTLKENREAGNTEEIGESKSV